MKGVQLDLFAPPPPAPDIPASRNVSRRDVWYCARRAVWTIDPTELCSKKGNAP